MRPPAERDPVPVDLDVRVVVLPLGQLPDPVDERERLGEVAELVLALQRSLNERVTSRNLHTTSIAAVGKPTCHQLRTRLGSSVNQRRTMSRIAILAAGLVAVFA